MKHKGDSSSNTSLTSSFEKVLSYLRGSCPRHNTFHTVQFHADPAFYMRYFLHSNLNDIPFRCVRFYLSHKQLNIFLVF